MNLWWKRIKEIQQTTDERMKKGIGIYAKKQVPLKITRPLVNIIKIQDAIKFIPFTYS
jgi:hypothetical protein